MTKSNDTPKHSGYSTNDSENQSHTPGSSSPSCSEKSNLSNSHKKNGTNSLKSSEKNTDDYLLDKMFRAWGEMYRERYK